MKKITVILSILAAGIMSAQQSQSVAAEKWKNGPYEYYNNNTFIKNKYDWYKNEEKQTLTIKKNAKGKICKISLTGKYSIGDFFPNDSLITDFVRHYSEKWSGMKKVYFGENSIVVYDLEAVTPKPDIRISYCIGAKPDTSLKSEIVKYLESTSNYYVPYTLSKAKDIESIKAEIIYPDKELVSGTYLDIGYTVKTKWGIEVKSKNLGGPLEMKNFNVAITQFQKYTSENTKSKFSWKIDGSKITNNEIEVVITLAWDKEGKYSTLIPVKYDTENSPVVQMNKILKEYDVVMYSGYRNGEYKSMELKNNPDNGYMMYPQDLVEISKKTKETDLLRVTKAGKIGYIHKSGKSIIPIEYEGGGVADFTEKVIPVKKDGKWGFINFLNQTVIDFSFDKVYSAVNGMYGVMKDKKIGYVTTKGKQITNTIYDNAWDFSLFDYAIVAINGKYGCIDRMGKVVVPIEFDKKPDDLNKELFSVYKNEKWGIMKKDGKMLFDYQYDEIFKRGIAYSEGGEAEKIIRVKKDGLYGYVKTDGKVLRQCIYSEAKDFVGPMASVVLNEGSVTKKGEVFTDGRENLNEVEIETSSDPVSSSSGKSSGGKSNPNDGWLVIKNVGKQRLYVMTDRGTTSWISAGGTNKWPCHTDIYYCYKDSHNTYNVKGSLIAKGKQNCGSVVSASGN